MQYWCEHHYNQKSYHKFVNQEGYLLSRDATHFHPTCQKKDKKKGESPKAPALHLSIR
jgi:hypothetical protein